MVVSLDIFAVVTTVRRLIYNKLTRKHPSNHGLRPNVKCWVGVRIKKRYVGIPPPLITTTAIKAKSAFSKGKSTWALP